jgi:hypothetical protein
VAEARRLSIKIQPLSIKFRDSYHGLGKCWAVPGEMCSKVCLRSVSELHGQTLCPFSFLKLRSFVCVQTICWPELIKRPVYVWLTLEVSLQTAWVPSTQRLRVITRRDHAMGPVRECSAQLSVVLRVIRDTAGAHALANYVVTRATVVLAVMTAGDNNELMY